MSNLYFIQAGQHGPIKIGYSWNPSARLADLQVGNHEELRLLAVLDLSEARRGTAEQQEALMHDTFAPVRIRGEWFRPVPELLRLIYCIQNNINGDIEPLCDVEHLR